MSKELLNKAIARAFENGGNLRVKLDVGTGMAWFGFWLAVGAVLSCAVLKGTLVIR